MAVDLKRAEALFLDAVDIDDRDARARFVEQACDDDELRGYVAELLLAHDRSDSLLDIPAVRPGFLAGFLASEPVEPEPTVVGPYRLVEPIGEGGMGVVYLAEQEQPVRRRVALKLIKAGSASEQMITRFKIELHALALMEHPNIARVHDAGTTSNGRPYFVMELVDGPTITEYCDRRRYTINERLALFVDVCRAVHHAHRKGIIHRDIKPSNILVAEIDDKGIPKVIDFGVAKAMGDGSDDNPALTGARQLIGTPLYMSPEQTDFSGRDVDTRSDIHALGAVLYELLAGVTPFDPARLAGTSFEEVRRIIRDETPPPPSLRLARLGPKGNEIAARRGTDLARLTRALRGDLDWIVLKALEKDRRRRYDSASDLADDVERHLTRRPVEASPPSRWYRVLKFARRNRTAIAAASMIATSLVVGLTVSIAQSIRAADAELRAENALAQTRRHFFAARLKFAADALEWGRTDRARAILEDPELDAEAGGDEFPLGYLTDQARGRDRDFRPEVDSPETVFPNPDASILACVPLEGALLFVDRDGNEIARAEPPAPIDTVAASWSPDGRRFAAMELLPPSKTSRPRAWIFEAATGRIVATLQCRATERIEQVELGADGRHLLVTSWLNSPKRRRLRIGTDPSPDGTIPYNDFGSIERTVVVSPDGEFVAARASNRTLLISIPDGRIVHRSEPTEASVSVLPLGLSEGGEFLHRLVGRVIEVVNPRTDEITARHELPETIRWGGADVAADGSMVAAADRNTGVVTLFHRRFGKIRDIETVTPRTSRIVWVRFSPSANLLALASTPSTPRECDTISLWNPSNGSLVERFEFPPGPLRSLEVPSGDRRVVFQIGDRTHVKSLAARILGGHGRECWSSSFTPDGRILVTGSDDDGPRSNLKFWDAQTGRLLRGISTEARTVSSISFSPDGRSFVAAMLTNTRNLEIRSTEDGSLTRGLVGHTARVRAAAYSPDGRRIASGGTDRVVRIWDPVTGETVASLAPHGGPVRALAFSPDSRRLVSSSNDHTLRIWMLDPIRIEHEVRGPNELGAAAISPDGRLVAAADKTGDILIWELKTGAPVATLPGDREELLALVFAPDGRTIAAAGTGGTIRIRDTLTGQELLALHGHRARVNTLAYSPDGRTLVSGDHEGEVRMWSAPPRPGSVSPGIGLDSGR